MRARFLSRPHDSPSGVSAGHTMPHWLGCSALGPLTCSRTYGVVTVLGLRKGAMRYALTLQLVAGLVCLPSAWGTQAGQGLWRR